MIPWHILYALNRSRVKREILEFSRQIEKMNTTLGGIKKLTKLPDVLFITDIRRDNIAVKEAKVLGIPLVGIADSHREMIFAVGI